MVQAARSPDPDAEGQVRKLITMEQLKEECHHAWMQLLDHESPHRLWRTGTKEYMIMYVNTGLRFRYDSTNDWTGEEPW